MISPGPGESTPAADTEPVASAYPQAAPSWPPAPVPRHRNRLVLVAVLGAAALLLVSGGTGAAVALRHRHSSRTRESGAAVGTPSRSPESNGHHSSNLLSYLLPQPADARHHDSTPDDGILDLADAAAYGAHPDTWRDELTSWKFVQGTRRRWVTADGRDVEVTLFQFADYTGATEFTRRVKTGTDGSSWGTPTSLPGAQAAFGYSRTTDDRKLRELCVAYSHDLFVQVSVAGEDDGDETVGPDLLRAQLALL